MRKAGIPTKLAEKDYLQTVSFLGGIGFKCFNFGPSWCISLRASWAITWRIPLTEMS